MRLDMLPVDDLFLTSEGAAENDAKRVIRKSEIERARAIVDQEIAIRANDIELPEEVDILINEAWKEVLVGMFLEEGEDGVRWQLALEITEELLWSLAPKQSSRDRKHLADMLPLLVSVLRQGLQTISWEESRIESMFASLEECHMARLKGQSFTVARAAPAEPAGSSVHGNPYMDMLEDVGGHEPVASSNVTSVTHAVNNEGWVFRADRNEWVFVGKPVQNVTLRQEADKNKEQLKIVHVRKIVAGDN